MKDLRILFMGTPAFAVGVLQQLIENGAPVVGVITTADKPAGRGRKLRESAVKEYARSQNLPILQPTNLKSESFLHELKTLNANLQIVVAFRMLPRAVWEMPEYGTFNLHASLLPQYRGAAPINWAVINGERETGVTTFFIDDKIDTGAIIASEKIELEDRETAGSLHDKLMVLGGELVLKTVALIKKGAAHPKPQPIWEVFKEAPKLTPENTRIDWSLPMQRMDAFIRGLTPYPVAWTILLDGSEEVKVKVYSCVMENELHSSPFGTIHTTKKELKVAVQGGYLFIKDLQLPGKRKMDVVSLLNGYKFGPDAKFV
jgi:methionyl-tRNA formyltransferase